MSKMLTVNEKNNWNDDNMFYKNCHGALLMTVL